MIKKYTKVIDEYTTHTLIAPEDSGITELCTIAGETYTHIPEGVTLPTQPGQITLLDVTLTDELRAEIKAASPHVYRKINPSVVERIREKYTANDELKMHREYVENGSTPETQAYLEHIAACRAWGTAEKAKIGL